MRVLRIAVPNGVESGLFALGRILVTSTVALFETTQIATNGVAGSIDQIASIVTNTMDLTIMPVVRQCIGAGEYDQAAYYTKKFMKIAYMLTSGMGGAIIVILPFTLGFYELSEETCRISVLLIALHNVLAFLLRPASFVLANSLRAAGDVKIAMYIGIGFMVVFRFGTVVLFGIIFRMGVAGVWTAMEMDWFARTIAFSIRYKSGKRRCVKVM